MWRQRPPRRRSAPEVIAHESRCSSSISRPPIVQVRPSGGNSPGYKPSFRAPFSFGFRAPLCALFCRRFHRGLLCLLSHCCISLCADATETFEVGEVEGRPTRDERGRLHLFETFPASLLPVSCIALLPISCIALADF
jgi:hypothetical protein